MLEFLELLNSRAVEISFSAELSMKKDLKLGGQMYLAGLEV